MKHSSLFESVLLLTAVALLSQLLHFFYQLVLSRLLLPSDLGFVHLALPVYYTVLGVLTSGFGQVICIRSAEYRAARQTARVESLFRRIHRYFLPVFCPVLLLLIVLLRRYFPGFPVLLYCVIPLLLLFNAEEIFIKQYFIGTGLVRIPAFLQITEQLVRIPAILLLLLLFPKSHTAPLAAVLTGMLISEVYSSQHLIHIFRTHTKSVSFDCFLCNATTEPPGGIPGIALPVSLTTLLTRLMSTCNAVIIPTLLVQGGMSREAALGQYGVLFGMTLPLLTVPLALTGALSTVLLPRLTRSRLTGHRGSFRRILFFSFAATFFPVVPGILLIGTFSSPLGWILFRQPDVGRCALPLTVGVCFSAFELISETALNAWGRQTSNAVITFLTALLQILITLRYTPTQGLWAYAAGFASSAFLGFLGRTLLLQRLCGTQSVSENVPLTRRTTPGI